MLKFTIETLEKSEIRSELIKTPGRRHGHHSSVFIVNYEHISHLFLVFLLLTLKVNASWEEDPEGSKYT